jgi:shikimate kinase
MAGDFADGVMAAAQQAENAAARGVSDGAEDDVVLSTIGNHLVTNNRNQMVAECQGLKVLVQSAALAEPGPDFWFHPGRV